MRTEDQLKGSGDQVAGESPLQAPDELAHTRERFAAIVDSSEDAIVSKTLDGIVSSWNRAAERIFGWTAEEMLGQSILRIIPDELQHEEAEILAKLRAGKRIERYETIRKHKDGSRLEISLTISPVRDKSGVIVGAAKIAHDITARRQAERSAREEAHALRTLNRVGKAVAAQLELERIVQIVTDAATEISGAAFGAFFYNVTGRRRQVPCRSRTRRADTRLFGQRGALGRDKRPALERAAEVGDGIRTMECRRHVAC